MTVMSGGSAEEIYMRGGTLEVLSGGSVGNVYYGYNNSINICVSGGIVDGLKSSGGGGWFRLEISEEGIVRNGFVYSDAEIVLTCGGRLENIIKDGSYITISDGAIMESSISTYWATISILDLGIVLWKRIYSVLKMKR